MKNFIRFGINTGKSLTGAELLVRAFQVASILPAIYIFILAGYPGLITRKGFSWFIFELGVSCIPRAESYLISLLFRVTSSEVLTSFVLLAAVLITGLIMAKLLRSKKKGAFITRCVLAALIAADIVIRLIPLGLNKAFGTVPNVLGIVFAVTGLAFTLADIIRSRKESSEGSSCP